ncbi:hypothetical protein [Herbiconiux sp.]|jgi:hypothetical protein|uniref:hypothetical protein n=1 Tax=Herbiconiux sp. TaxID=1871186 RepID=UPI0025C53E9A|nr:hypothetical protein [Herbiconiux sp.]
MYAALWRILPGPIWVRILIVVVLLAAVLFALATWVFPWIDDITTPVQEVTVGQ